MQPEINEEAHLESQVGDPESIGTLNASARMPNNPATQKQKIFLIVFLFSLTVISLFMTYDIIGQINEKSLAEVSTPWILPDSIVLKDGAAGFYYEAEEGSLIHSGPITAARKLILRDLLEPQLAAPSIRVPDSVISQSDPTANPNTLQKSHGTNAGTFSKKYPENLEEVRKSYNQAIDRLTYLSNMNQGELIQHMLLLGLFGGALGAILRSLVDFVGHACYTGKLDLSVWWPLYLTRPIVGAILGFVLIVLFKAKLLVAGEAPLEGDSFWWLGVSVLGGFSTVDVTLRLRIAAKALFGGGSGDK